MGVKTGIGFSVMRGQWIVVYQAAPRAVIKAVFTTTCAEAIAKYRILEQTAHSRRRRRT